MPPELPTKGQREGRAEGQDPRHAIDAKGAVQADATPTPPPNPGAEAGELSPDPELDLSRMSGRYRRRQPFLDHEGALTKVVGEVQAAEDPSPTEIQHSATACASSQHQEPVDVDREEKCCHANLQREDATLEITPQ